MTQQFPQGWGSYTDPSGQVWPEPPSGAPPEVASFIQNVLPPPAAPAAPIAPAAPPPTPLTPAQMSAEMDAPFPMLTPGQADRAPTAQAPDLTPGLADRTAPSMIPVTTTESSSTTTGMDAGSRANVNAATGQANSAAQAAGDAKIGELNATADLQRRQSQEAYGRGVNTYFENLAGMQAQDEIIRETTARLDEAARFKPDRTALFNGDQGVLFGVSAAVAAMAGGWLMGQGLTGGKNPYLSAVLQMIDDNARDQAASNSQVYQELTRRLGSAEAAKRELKARQLQALNDTIDAKAQFEKADLVQQGAGAVKAQIESEIARNNLDAAKLTSKTVSNTVQKKTQMMPNVAATGGVDVTNPQEYARVGKVAALRDFEAEARGLAESGALADNVGFLDGKWGWVKGVVNARDPAQARVEKLKSLWELAQRQSWASEPNGQAVQERLSTIGFPQNDQEIPLFLQSVREALNTADPGGRYRIAAGAMGNRPQAAETRRIPIVR